MNHPLSRLTGLVDWNRLDDHFAPYYSSKGRTGLPIRLMIGLNMLKHIYALSDEEVCARWEENPYFQYFCGEVFFQHRFPIERSSLTHFRNRIDPSALEAVLQESLAIACGLGALRLKDLKSVAVDTTVQEKNVTYPTDHGLLRKAITKLAGAAQRAGVKLRQSYVRVTQRAAMKVGRYLHANQRRRANRELKFMRVRLGRLIRDVERKIEKASDELVFTFKDTLCKAKKIWKQKRKDPDYMYSWHEPEVECIGKGKARHPYEFGNKVSIATNLRTSTKKGKYFVVHTQALHGRPYDGHTLKGAIEHIKKIVGRSPERVLVDKGYKGHKVNDTQVFLSGQKRGVTAAIRRDIRRRSVIEPIIGHTKHDGLMGRNYLKGRRGDLLNAILASIGFNFRQLIAVMAL
jgi:IS5 family transposase